MSDSLHLILALAAGLLLGLIFFGGLWWTVRKDIATPHAAIWFMGSMVLRTGGALAGFYLVSAGQWERLLMCLSGFIIARFFVIRLTERRAACCSVILQETRHAPEP